MRVPTHARAIVVLCSAVVLLGGCFGSDPELPENAGTPTTLPAPTAPVADETEAATDPAFAAFYDQPARWSSCGNDRDCAEVEVPVDWDDPAGETLEIAMVRYPAGGKRIGSLLINPGGPGGSGFDFVHGLAEQLTSERVRERYDLVGFDPRGVGRSEALDCVSDRALDAHRAFDPDADLETDTAAAISELRAEARTFAAGCAADAGPLLGHLDTLSVARDMDVMRAAVGDERLNFLGYSYGTLLGATYADEFPQRVGRLVLDGALDPASSDIDVVRGQAIGMERALRAFVDACLAGDTGEGCPLRGTPEEAMGQVAELLEKTDERPLSTDDRRRRLTEKLAFIGLIAPLYDDAEWPALKAALVDAFRGDGSRLLALADGYAEREPDGSYRSNIEEVFTAVNCLDYPVDDDPAAMQAAADDIERAAPVLGQFMVYGEVLCGEWPVPAVRTPGPIRATDAAPILVIGTTGDPATPYEWAQALADQLESGRLLTYEGEGHTAFGRGSRCVDDTVDSYLVRGVLVGEGGVCQ